MVIRLALLSLVFTASAQVCRNQKDCGEDKYCSERYSECKPFRAEGQYCDLERSCLPKLICDLRDSMCVQREAKCGSDRDCSSNFYCDVNVHKCFKRSCSDDSDCSARYQCVSGGCTARKQETYEFVLVAPVSALVGARCTRDLDCVAGTYCRGGDSRLKNKGACAFFKSEGAICSELDKCAKGQLCVAKNFFGSSGTCKPSHEKGYAKVRPGSSLVMANRGNQGSSGNPVLKSVLLAELLKAKAPTPAPKAGKITVPTTPAPKAGKTTAPTTPAPKADKPAPVAAKSSPVSKQN